LLEQHLQRGNQNCKHIITDPIYNRISQNSPLCCYYDLYCGKIADQNQKFVKKAGPALILTQYPHKKWQKIQVCALKDGILSATSLKWNLIAVKRWMKIMAAMSHTF
jgi:hypothetical protein